MMVEIIKLATSQSKKPKRACATCRYREGGWCGAAGGTIRWQRASALGPCGIDGELWEPELPKTPWPGVFSAIKKFLYGAGA